MSWISGIRSVARRLIACDRGSVMVTMGVSAVMLIGAVGTAVDIGRLQVAQSKLQTALDAAGLAAGSMLTTTNLNDEVRKYLEANFAGESLDATLVNFTATPNADDTIIELSATATLPATFMKLFGHDIMTVSAATEITRQTTGMEVALVLDVTGSMCQPCSKIDSLKVAAHDLLDILFGSQDTVDDLWVGIVPFSQAVNTGTSRTPWRNAAQFATLNYFFAGHTWSGCFEERYGPNNRDVTDDPPAVETFKTYFAPDTSSSGVNNWRGSLGQNLVNAANNIWANAYCPDTVVTPLTNQKSTLGAGIDALKAGGNTHINVGAVWGWRMLSPRWRGVWGGTMDANQLPLDYHSDKSQKAAIIMTDGVNTMSSSIYTAYGLLSAGNLGTTSSSTAVTKLNNKTSQVCNSMKANGIIIYTILFEENSSTAINLMKNCASQVDYFFQSATEDELKTAFHTIGDSLSKLRVSK